MTATVLCVLLLALCTYLVCVIVFAPPSEEERRMMEHDRGRR